uniref:Grh/CP2 DB domain-containing protein n=1 Tax=Schistocephalus solidus TaxID=70667 RepID=A0A0X3PBR8_SCHSO
MLKMDPDFDFNFTDSSLSVHKTLLSLNSNLPDSKFSMRDALSALPVNPDEHRTETFQTSKQRIQDATNFPTTLLTIELKAPTSPATRIDEDSLTYLNQGQSYDLRLSESFGEERMLIQSIVRICFHEEKMQFMESKHLELWQSAHPGERLLDIEADKCIGCRDAFSDPVNLNAVVCIWDSSNQCTLVVKAFCVSTEFTAKKHGGEKGVPFRIQVDSFREADHTHIYSAACQVKVFKTKGAERKNRTDKEKIERKPAADRLNYKPSTPSTFLEEISYFPPFSRLMIDDSSSCCPLIDSRADSDFQVATPCFASPSQTDERSSSPRFSTAFHSFPFAYDSSNLPHPPPPFSSSPPPPFPLTLTQPLEDDVVGSARSVNPSESTLGVTTTSTSTATTSVMLHERSTQEHFETELGEIGLAAARRLRPHADLRQRQARGSRSPPGGSLQPPVKNGRRLGSPTRGSRPEFSRVSTEPTIAGSLCTWPDQPVTPVPDNVDLLPFSQCDISGSRHYQQASKTIPLSVHSSSASSETFFFPSVDVPEAEQPPTLASFPLFKQPALRRLPCWEPSELPVPVDVRTGTAIPSPQRVHGKKRGVGSGAAACSISSVPCPGICATCGRACPGSMTEFGVKRQRRRRQTVHRLLKGYSFPKLPSLTSVCTSETPTSLPGIKQQEVAVPSPGLLVQPCCSRTLQTSDYSSYSQQTGDEEVRGQRLSDLVIPSNSLSDLESGRQLGSQERNGDGEDDGEEEDDYDEDGVRDGDEEEEDGDDEDDDEDDQDEEEEEEEDKVAEGDDEDDDYDGEVAAAPCQRLAQNPNAGCTVSEPTKVHASVTVSSSAQIPVPSPEGLTLAVAPSPSAEAASRCPKTPRPLDTPAPCLESVLRSGNGGSGLRKARPFKPDMNRAAVANWLRSSGFGNLRSKFGRFSGCFAYV